MKRALLTAVAALAISAAMGPAWAQDFRLPQGQHGGRQDGGQQGGDQDHQRPSHNDQRNSGPPPAQHDFRAPQVVQQPRPPQAEQRDFRPPQIVQQQQQHDFRVPQVVQQPRPQQVEQRDFRPPQVNQPPRPQVVQQNQHDFRLPQTDPRDIAQPPAGQRVPLFGGQNPQRDQTWSPPSLHNGPPNPPRDPNWNPPSQHGGNDHGQQNWGSNDHGNRGGDNRDPTWRGNDNRGRDWASNDWHRDHDNDRERHDWYRGGHRYDRDWGRYDYGHHRRDDYRYRYWWNSHSDFHRPRYYDWRSVRHGYYFDSIYARIVASFYGRNYYWWSHYPYGQRPWREWAVGYILPQHIWWEPVPYDLYWRLPPAPYGCRYIMVDRDILLIAVDNGMVLDALMYY